MPNPHAYASASRIARRKQLKSDPELVRKITAEHIATARWFLTQYDVGNERRPLQAAICGTLYKRMELSLAKLSGYRCPEAVELKRLLTLYKAQITAVPLCFSEDEIRSRTHSIADFWEEHCEVFIKGALSAYRKGKLTAETKADILDLIAKYRAMLDQLYTPGAVPRICELHAKLNTIERLLAPATGHA